MEYLARAHFEKKSSFKRLDILQLDIYATFGNYNNLNELRGDLAKFEADKIALT